MKASPSEPVGAQQRQREIEEEARRNGEAKDHIEHVRPLHPFRGTDRDGKGDESADAKRQINNASHVQLLQLLKRTVTGGGVRRICGRSPKA